MKMGIIYNTRAEYDYYSVKWNYTEKAKDRCFICKTKRKFKTKYEGLCYKCFLLFDFEDIISDEEIIEYITFIRNYSIKIKGLEWYKKHRDKIILKIKEDGKL